MLLIIFNISRLLFIIISSKEKYFFNFQKNLTKSKDFSFRLF